MAKRASPRRPLASARRRKPIPPVSVGDKLLIGTMIGLVVLILVFQVSAQVARATTGRCLKCVLTRDYQCAFCPPPGFRVGGIRR